MGFTYGNNMPLISRSKFNALPWVFLFSSIIFIGAFCHLELIFVCVAIVACLVFVVCPGSTNQVCISTCLWLLLLQNLMIGLGSHLGGNDSSELSLLTQIPFLLIASVFFGSKVFGADFETPASLEFKSNWVVLLVLLISALFFVGGSPVASKLVSVRNLLMFYMGYKLASNQCGNSGEYLKVLKQLVNVSLVATVFGILMMLQSVSFWESIGIYEVYIAKQSPIEAGSLGGRFYTSLNGVTDVLRMGSLYYEPVNLAYLLFAGLIASFFLWRTKRIGPWSLLVISLGFVLTFGKGGYILLAFLVIVCLCNKLLATLANKSMHRTRFVSYLICFVAIGAVLYAYYLLVGGPVQPHFWALEQTMSSILSNPVGHGLGTGGNMSVAGSDYSKGAESAVMTIGYQIGILGILSVFMILRDIADVAPKSDSLSSLVAYYLPLVLFAVSVLQENTFSPQCIFPTMVLIASLQRFAREDGEGLAVSHADSL